MENAADALKMAAAVLIFVLALSISINAFGEARKASQIILDYNDREYDSMYVEDNKTTERIVGLETIVPSIYRAYKENYKIVFSNSCFEDGVYKKKDKDNPYGKEIYYIDLEKETLGSDIQKENFINAILYGENYSNFEKIQKEFNDNFGILLNDEGIYDKIQRIIDHNYEIKEKLGVYYQEELDGGDSTPDANKTKKRVITYLAEKKEET